MLKTHQFRAEFAGESNRLTPPDKETIFDARFRKTSDNMPLIRLLHAFATGAATFSLNPMLPHVPPEASSSLKTSNEAFTEDAIKLSGDFSRALLTVKAEAESHGQSVSAKT